MEMQIRFAVWLTLAALLAADDNRIPHLLESGNIGHTRKHEDNPLRKLLASSPGKYLGQLTDTDPEHFRKMLRGDDMTQFTPPPITEIQCHVEVQVTQRVPGRCTKLGGRIPACQAQDFITIDYNECS